MLRCLADLTEEEAQRSPVGGLSPIVWQAGHTALTDYNMARRADGRTQAPDGYEKLFEMGTGGPAVYPSLSEVREHCTRAQAILEEIAKTANLDAPVDGRSYSTVHEMLTFAVYHRGYHVGKVTTLRALLHKPRLFG
jgi:hypothetical protein